MTLYVLRRHKKRVWKDMSESISVAAHGERERREWAKGLQSCLQWREYLLGYGCTWSSIIMKESSLNRVSSVSFVGFGVGSLRRWGTWWRHGEWSLGGGCAVIQENVHRDLTQEVPSSPRGTFPLDHPFEDVLWVWWVSCLGAMNSDSETGQCEYIQDVSIGPLCI